MRPFRLVSATCLGRAEDLEYMASLMNKPRKASRRVALPKFHSLHLELPFFRPVNAFMSCNANKMAKGVEFGEAPTKF